MSLGVKPRGNANLKTEPDLGWVETKVKLAILGICPFCGAIIDIDEPHQCNDLPAVVSNLSNSLIKEFSETEVLLVGPSYFTITVADKIKKKYPNIKLYIIYRPS